MTLGKIDHIDLFVGDLEKAEKHFTEKLGFKLLRHTEHAGKSVELQSPAGDFFLDLHQGSEESYRKESERSPGWPYYFNHVAFRVDDINKEYEDLKSKGVSFRQDAPVFVPPTGRTVADVADADGHFWIQLTDV